MRSLHSRDGMVNRGERRDGVNSAPTVGEKALKLARLAFWTTDEPDRQPAVEAAAPDGRIDYFYNGKPLVRRSVDINAIIGQLEQDVSLTMRLIQHTAGEARARVAESVDLAGQIQTGSRGLAKLSESARQTSDRLVDTSRALEASNREIQRQVASSDTLLEEARALTGSVSRQMQDLGEVARTIAGVVDIIRAVARQTNMLALNATIEAARAGAAGRGFSVIATEIKALAGEVQHATADISTRIAGIEQAVGGSAQTMTRMADLIGRLDPVMASICAAAGTQIASSDDMTGKAIATADFADAVARNAEAMHELARRAAAIAGLAGQASDNMEVSLGRHAERSIMYFRRSMTSPDTDTGRVPVFLPGLLTLAAGVVPVTVVELSGRTVMLDRWSESPEVSSRGALFVEGIGKLMVEVNHVSELAVHLDFVPTDDLVAEALADCINAVELSSAGEAALIQSAAEELARRFEDGIASGRISEDALFSTDYRQVPHTQPVQYTVPALAFLEEMIPQVIERDRKRIADCWYFLAIDRNGYVPVHHPEYSLPPNPADVVWTDLNARNRRIMLRAQTLEAARNTRPLLMTAFRREMKDGTARFGKLIAAPIVVRGRLWGNAVVSAANCAHGKGPVDDPSSRATP